MPSEGLLPIKQDSLIKSTRQGKVKIDKGKRDVFQYAKALSINTWIGTVVNDMQHSCCLGKVRRKRTEEVVLVRGHDENWGGGGPRSSTLQVSSLFPVNTLCKLTHTYRRAGFSIVNLLG